LLTRAQFLQNGPLADSKWDHSERETPADGYALCPCHERPRDRRAAEQRDELASLHSILGIGSGPVNINSHVAPGPTQLPQLLQQRRNASLRYWTILILRDEHADTPHALVLLRARRERPRRRRAAEERSAAI
jgi:hypothetical protein